ncbi:MAG: Mut7-C RNAse domain-containing protein [Candidatus Hermodarchaeota archaeon]
MQRNHSLFFLADSMLGRLAVWLRMLSNQTKYFTSIKDDEILLILGNEILLTRDIELHKRALARGFESLLIKGSDTRSQFIEVLEAYSININPFQPCCVQCSGSLQLKTPLENLELPATIEYKDFWQCTSCKKIYWRGLKWKGFIEPLIGEILPITYIQCIETNLLVFKDFSDRKWFIWTLNAVKSRKNKEKIKPNN